jgi:hypothetical protein
MKMHAAINAPAATVAKSHKRYDYDGSNGDGPPI